MSTQETRTATAAAPGAPRAKGPRGLAHAVLDRALRAVRRDLERVEKRTGALEARATELETIPAKLAKVESALASAKTERLAHRAELQSIRASIVKLTDALAAAETERESDRAELLRRTGELTRALVELSRGTGDTGVIEPVIDAVIDRKLTYLGRPMLRDLADVAREADESGLPGILVETGCAKGGSALVMAAAKASARPLKVYDVFGMIPPPGEGDAPKSHSRYEEIKSGRSKGISSDQYYGYEDDLLGEVRRAFDELGLAPEATSVTFVQGLFQDTLHGDEPVAVAHLDGDWYESTLVCLERLGPRIVAGGRFVLDDYDFWEGCRRAVDEWLLDHPEFEKERRNRLHLVRKTD